MLTVTPGAVYFHVSNLLTDTEVRIDWASPLEVVTSYEVVYSIYEAVNTTRRIRLNSNTTSYVIKNLSKWLTNLKADSLMIMFFYKCSTRYPISK